MHDADRMEEAIKLDAISFLCKHNLPLEVKDDLAELLKLMMFIGEQRTTSALRLK